MLLRPGRLALVLLAFYALAGGYWYWSTRPRYPVTRPASALVVQAADLPAVFRPVPGASQAIADNPYDDHTRYYRSGQRAEYATAGDPQWGNTRLVSTSFVLDRRGAEKVYRMYLNQMRYRGEAQVLPTLGQESLFAVARDEAAAPVVIIGVVRAENALITLTVLTDRTVDTRQVYAWAAALVERARPG